MRPSSAGKAGRKSETRRPSNAGRRSMVSGGHRPSKAHSGRKSAAAPPAPQTPLLLSPPQPASRKSVITELAPRRSMIAMNKRAITVPVPDGGAGALSAFGDRIADEAPNTPDAW